MLDGKRNVIMVEKPVVLRDHTIRNFDEPFCKKIIKILRIQPFLFDNSPSEENLVSI